jgi:hypothetical protein
MHRFCRFCSRVPVRCAGGHARPAVPPSVAVLVPGRPPASHRMRHDSLPYSAALCRRAAVLCHRRFPRRPRLRPTHRPFALVLLTNFSHSIPISLRAADQPDKTPPPAAALRRSGLRRWRHLMAALAKSRHTQPKRRRKRSILMSHQPLHQSPAAGKSAVRTRRPLASPRGRCCQTDDRVCKDLRDSGAKSMLGHMARVHPKASKLLGIDGFPIF